ncbi:hypothetical protein BX600DRAFT_220405 [Xylariales sp. PMI_506]|nr:hypothetical protein BX600DRAFT_220405 [Xylariales sp. PMI_506]
MEPPNAAQKIIEGKGQSRAHRRSSFSPIRGPIKALRTLSITSQISNASDTDGGSPVSERRRSTLRKLVPAEHIKEELARRPSNARSEDNADAASNSTRPTTPSVTGSHEEDTTALIKAGPLQSETSLLKSRREHLVLSDQSLLRFKSQSAAIEQFPQLSTRSSAAETLSPVNSVASFREFTTGVDLQIPLERVVSVFKEEGSKPCFGIEVWWRDGNSTSPYSGASFDFALPEDRDDWLKQIQLAVRHRMKMMPEEQIPSTVEAALERALEAKYPLQQTTQLDVFPVIPRRPYTGLRSNTGEVKKGWRDGSSFYLAFSKNFCILAQFVKSSTGQRLSPNIVQFGLVTLSRVDASINDERFDLIFRLPLEKPKHLELSSRHHRGIISRLFKADTYLKPAWPLWTRNEIFYIDGASEQIPLPEGEDYGGFKRTLEAFLEGYECSSVAWKVNWRGVKYPPEFQLLPPQNKKRYSVKQLLAVFRALRFNDYFKSLSFHNVNFSALSGLFDNKDRLEPTIWLSRTGKRTLTRDEYEVLEKSSILFQEIVALLLGSESVRHIDLSFVLPDATIGARSSITGSGLSQSLSCEVVPPIVFLLRSLQTRCKSIILNGNPLSSTDVSEINQILQYRPGLMRGLGFSQCKLDDMSMILLWEAIHEQRHSLEVLEFSRNFSCLEATRISRTLREANKICRLDLAHCLKGDLDGPLFHPWNTSPYSDAWVLEEVDLSGWKVNFDTIRELLHYMELEESGNLKKLCLNNCGISGEIATAILCKTGAGRDLHLQLNSNPLESGSTDWIDLIHENEAPRKLHLDMIQFSHEINFNRLLRAFANNDSIEFLSLVGTGPPNSSSSETPKLLSQLFETNTSLTFLDISGYSGKLEDVHLGWSLSDSLRGLKQNTTLRQLRMQNHDMGSGEDVNELCRVIAANKGLAMLDIRHNSFDHDQFSQLVHSLGLNRSIISFPMAPSDCDHAVDKEKRQYMRQQSRHSWNWRRRSIPKMDESRLDGLIRWVREHWNSEVKAAMETLERNRNSPTTLALQLEAENLHAWEDASLSPALLARLSVRNTGSGLDNRSSIYEPMRASSFVIPSKALDMDGVPRSFGLSEPALRTYTIEEESLSSDFDATPSTESPGSLAISLEEDHPTAIGKPKLVTDYMLVLADDDA